MTGKGPGKATRKNCMTDQGPSRAIQMLTLTILRADSITTPRRENSDLVVITSGQGPGRNMRTLKERDGDMRIDTQTIHDLSVDIVKTMITKVIVDIRRKFTIDLDLGNMTVN